MTTATAEPVEGEVIETAGTAMVEAINRAEIDVQIATAHRYPRSMTLFKKRAVDMATSDEETAESCIYRRPVGKKKNEQTGKWETEFAEGMSVRMAEIVGACYGNIRVYATLISQTDRQVIARGMAHDLESNFASSSEIVEATVTKNGEPFSERMRAVVAKAALAKARRDAMFQVVPRALAKPVEYAVRQVLMGDAESMEKRRTRVVGWLTKLSIDPARVYASLGVVGPADLTAEHLEKLTGIKTAIKDGDATIDEAFPPTDGNGTPPTGSKADDLAEQLKAKQRLEELRAQAGAMSPEQVAALTPKPKPEGLSPEEIAGIKAQEAKEQAAPSKGNGK